MHIVHWTETWGSVDYHKLLVTEYMNDEIISTATSAIASTVTFLYPTMVKSGYYLDGKAKGHFKLYNKSTSAATTVTGYTIKLEVINNVGTHREIATHTEVIASGNSVATVDYIAIPFFLNISKAEVSNNEKLALTLTATGGSDLCFAYDNWADTEDLKIEIPYAPVSGG